MRIHPGANGTWNKFGFLTSFCFLEHVQISNGNMYEPNEHAILESYHSARSLTAVDILPEVGIWVTCHKMQNV